MNTPYGKDVVKLLAEVCHARKMPLCLYYSIADWHQPSYPNQGRHHELPPQAGDQPGLTSTSLSCWRRSASYAQTMARFMGLSGT